MIKYPIKLYLYYGRCIRRCIKYYRFFVSLYGGLFQDLLTLTIGMLIIFLTITLKLQSQEQDIRILQAQINTQNELKRISEEIKQIKGDTHKK